MGFAATSACAFKLIDGEELMTDAHPPQSLGWLSFLQVAVGILFVVEWYQSGYLPRALLLMVMMLAYASSIVAARSRCTSLILTNYRLLRTEMRGLPPFASGEIVAEALLEAISLLSVESGGIIVGRARERFQLLDMATRYELDNPDQAAERLRQSSDFRVEGLQSPEGILRAVEALAHSNPDRTLPAVRQYA